MNTIQVENLKCGGCANTIVNGLSTIEGVEDVSVDNKTDTVSYKGDESTRELVKAKLISLGYPEKGSVKGLTSGLATAKSYVSCVIGKFT